MGLGRMSSKIQILESVLTKDSEGFAISVDRIRAEVMAYYEDRRGTEAWKNRAVFSSSNVLFRFRFIPGLIVTTSMWIVMDGIKYNITDVENVRNRGMYWEVLAERVEPSGGVYDG